MTTPRALKRQAIDERIMAAGREQLASVGAAAISLRAIARELDMVSSAIYRYVESRDELLTRLVVEAFEEVADAADAAAARVPATAYRARIVALARAIRQWSVDHPAQFALLYGSPVPGYDAPADRTTQPGTRVMIALITALADAAATDDLDVPGAADPDPALCDDLQRIRAELDVDLDDDQFVYAMSLWTWLIGAVGQEVFDGFGADTFRTPATLFDAQLGMMLGGRVGDQLS